MSQSNDNSEFIQIILAEGYIPTEGNFVQEVLTEMYNYLSKETGLGPEQLSYFLKQLEYLLGIENLQEFELKDIASWLNTLKDFPTEND